MQSPRVYFNNIGSICTDSLRHGIGLSALLLLTRAAKSSAAKSSASKTRSMESRLNAAHLHFSSRYLFAGKFVLMLQLGGCYYRLPDRMFIWLVVDSVSN